MVDNVLLRPNVLLVFGFMAPCRIPLFSELAARFPFEVWVLADVRRFREWSEEVPEGAFQYRMMPNVRIPTGSQDYQVVINYSLPLALARHRHDAVISVGWDTPAAVYTALHARITRTPFVLWAGSTAGEPSWRRTLGRPITRSVVRTADAWVAYGSRSKEYLVALGADADRVFCAYNAVDTTRFAAAGRMADVERKAFRDKLGVGDAPLVFYCGQLIDRKGLADLLPAFSRLVAAYPDAALVVAGTGRREAQFRALAEAAGIGDCVKFVGFVAQADLPKYYAAADLLALPSRQEVWGLVINEALACGTPVLTTDAVGATPDLMQHGANGYVVPPGSPEALADALLRHFSAGTNRAAMREAARKSIEPFTIARSADAFVAAVSCALARHRIG